MNIFLKIKYIFVFITFLTSKASSADLVLQENVESAETPTSITASLGAMHLPPREIEAADTEEVSAKKVSIDEEAVLLFCDKNSLRINRQASAKSLKLHVLTAMPKILSPTLTFRSSETGAEYALEYVIGKSIKDHIQLLKKNGILQGEDEKRYNYGSPVACVPPVPEYILAGNGLKAINKETIITEEVVAVLRSFRCVLSFCFDKQIKLSDSPLLTPAEIEFDKWFRQQMTHEFLIKNRHPNNAMSTNVLHFGYYFANGKVSSKFS